VKPTKQASACLTTFLGEIRALEGSEFPYVSSLDGLKVLDQLVVQNLTRLESLDPSTTPAVVRQQCALALSVIWKYLPIVGFILRSTNVRNAFEVYGPCLRLARKLLEPSIPAGQSTTKLILSSEWSYSPFIYKEFPELVDFVLIGLPAHESGNPLLVPLAGHELGHRLWAKKPHHFTFAKKVLSEVIRLIEQEWGEYTQAFPLIKIKPAELSTNLYALESYRLALAWAMKQVEETYCDLIGLRLFGKSYLHAFSYILSPSTPGGRAVFYPNFTARVGNLEKGAAAFSIEVPQDYGGRFQDMPMPKLLAGEKFQSKIADLTLVQLFPDILKHAESDVTAAAIPSTSETESKRVTDRFRLAVPAENIENWISIVNAGWIVYEDDAFWSGNSSLQAAKDRVLKELMLKNIEIFEIEQILKEP
jgi:hypothetical protein